ncbi:MAG TPA: TonB-dependent receptor [Vicinamibacterales bacterium]|nr:TonB-dependent receptor [Vicinamibacterales bacterium]
MASTRFPIALFMALAGLLLFSAGALADTGIAGVVKDATGAVMPGVTVEAASPALIERVRTVVTDAQGQYKIIDLRPGTYSVTFTLAGFSTVKRDGIVLTTDFTASVNAEMRVGALEETITVSGATPVVDVQNVVQQSVLTKDIADALPTGRNFQSYAALVPGMALGGGQGAPPQDVGGLVQANNVTLSIHGSRLNDMTETVDGFLFSSMVGRSSNTYTSNAGMVEEYSFETAALSAELGVGGVAFNIVPKDGGNRFAGSFIGSYSNHNLESNNLTLALQARGLTSVNRMNDIWDVNPSFGGPLMKDKLWFFTSYRNWGYDNQVAGLYYSLTPTSVHYTPDLGRPGIDDARRRKENLRLTWQIDDKNKLSLNEDHEYICVCHRLISPLFSPEATQYGIYPLANMAWAKWTATLTNRLLVEAGLSIYPSRFVYDSQPGTLDAADISIKEQSTGFTYRSYPMNVNTFTQTDDYKAAVSYVTGSHAFKTGFELVRGERQIYTKVNGNVNYNFLNGVPSSIVEWTTPYSNDYRLNADLGIYAQDKWTFRTLTLNLGLRYDYINSSVPASQNPTVQFVGERDFPEVPNAPNWKDISPRLGAVYDLFGNGKTAIKITLSRYVASETTTTAALVDPLATSVNSTTRTWKDSNGNFIPDCDMTNPAANGECGALSNQGFGHTTATTIYDPALLKGFGSRGYNWETSVGIQQELLPRVAMNASYFRRSYGNFTVTNNQAVTAASFDPYCVTAPQNSLLPGSGGNQICGLYDVTPALFGKVNNLVTFAKSYGTQTDVYNGFDLAVNARLPRGAVVQGGLNVGREETSNCGVVLGDPQLANPNPFITGSSPTLPRSQAYCDIRPPFQPQVKLLGTYPLPWDFQAAATFQSLPGPMILATQTITNAQISPSLGRNLAAGPNATVNVDLIPPGTQYEERLYQLDLRLTKVVKVGRTRFRANFDLGNALNASSILTINTTYGPSWLRPTAILPGRVFKFAAILDF